MEDALMNGVMWLRISAIVSLLFAGGHTLGGRSSWSPVGDNEVLVSMRTVHFHFQGVSRSFLDFYRGFGYSLSVFLVLQGIVLWQLAVIAKTQPHAIRPLVASFAIASVIGAVITWIFIFPIPAMFSAALTSCLVIAYVTLG
jgi:hypothetical protein